jgi:monovalent cation:H+ antiporter-2, CPA2 family
MIGVGVIMLAAALACAVSRLAGLPLIPLYLLSGWLLWLVGVETPEDFAAEALQLGVAVLVFLAGTELNPQRIVADRQRAALLSIVPMLVTAGCMFLWLRLNGTGPQPALYLAAALAGSSTIVAIRQLRRLCQTREPFGRLLISVQLLQDFFLVGVLVFVAALPDGWIASLLALGKSSLLLAVALFLQTNVVPRVLARTRLGDETLLMLMLALLFAFGAGAAALGLPLVVGAFVAGLAISRFPANGLLRVQLAALGDFFFAIFFVTLGYVAGLPAPGTLVKAIGLALVIVILRPAITTVLARLLGLSARPAVESSLLLGQAGELGLVIGLGGLGNGSLSAADFSLLAAVTAFTMMLTPFLATDGATSWLLHHLPRRRPPNPGSLRGHVLLLGYGAAGRWVLKSLQKGGCNVFVVDDDPAVIAHLEANGIPCLRGDGSDPYVLAAAGADDARILVCNMRRSADAAKVLRFLGGNVPAIVRVFETREADQIQRLGGIPVLNSTAAAHRFLEWFDASSHRCASASGETKD